MSDGLLLSSEELNIAEQAINADVLIRHTSVLASNEFQGRFPATIGEERTINYLSEEFKKLGLTGPDPKEGFVQSVPLVKITPQKFTPKKRTNLFIKRTNASEEPLELKDSTEFTAVTSSAVPDAHLQDVELVFAGYGIKADPFGWNDFKKSVKGKAIVVFVNDPGYDTANEAKPLFKGKNMTYFGRWTYKFDEAVRQEAAAIFIVHNTGAAGYPWSIVSDGRAKPNFKLRTSASGHVTVTGWITEDTARTIFQRAGYTLEELKKRALDHASFEAVSLNQSCTLSLSNEIAELTSRNAVAWIQGQSDEHVVFTAHWDHFGVNQETDQDPPPGEWICSGARDNGIGVAALLALAEAFLKVPKEKRLRSVLILVPTVEEFGLLGSDYYTKFPSVPLSKCLACFNFDLINIFGKTHDISFYGSGQNNLEQLAHHWAMSRQQREVKPDPTPENGMYYRSDHFNFARAGVPALFINQGFDHVTKGREWLLNKNQQWTAQCYHKPRDKIVLDPNDEWCWDLAGAVDDVRLIFDVAANIVGSKVVPAWNSDSEFRKV